MSGPARETAVHVPAGIRDARSYSPELESMRGVACLLVFGFHAAGIADPVAYEAINPALAFIYAGHTGVTLFFVLSAFFLSRPFLEQAAGGPRVSWRNFWKRRALRILPLYYCAVAFACVMLAQRPADLLHGLPYFVFVTSTSLVTSFKPYSDVWWSLSTEWQFYLVLPLASLCLLSRRGRVLGAVLLLFYAISYALFAAKLVGPRSILTGLDLGFSLFGRAPALLCGVAAAWIWLRHRDSIRAALHGRAWLRRGGADALLLLLLWGLGSLLALTVRETFFDSEAKFHFWHVPEALAWMAVVLWILLAPVHSAALFQNRIFRGLGVLSYSLYLVHLPILYAIQIPNLDLLGAGRRGWTARAWLGTAAGFALSLAVSVVTYRLIERPS